MTFRDLGTTIVIVVVTAAVVGYVSSKYLGHDNIVEESAETIIEKNTGWDIDLSPSSPE